MVSNHTVTYIMLAIIAISILIILFFYLDLADDRWSAFGQTTTTPPTPNPVPTPPAQPELTTVQSTATPAVNVAQPIATTDDLANQFNTLLATSGTGIIGGVGALWAIVRKKTSKIDNALRGADFDNRDLLEIMNSIFEHAKKNPDKSLGAILDMPAFKDRVLTNTTIAVAWDKEYNEYDEWFTQRYVMNKN